MAFPSICQCPLAGFVVVSPPVALTHTGSPRVNPDVISLRIPMVTTTQVVGDGFEVIIPTTNRLSYTLEVSLSTAPSSVVLNTTGSPMDSDIEQSAENPTGTVV
jgi:hypothetical protein